MFDRGPTRIGLHSDAEPCSVDYSMNGYETPQDDALASLNSTTEISSAQVSVAFSGAN
jgi:hypothetical protein